MTEFNLWVSFSFSGELPSSSFKTQFRMEEPAGRISALGRLFRREFPQRAKAVSQQTGPTVKNAEVFAASRMNRRLRRQTAGGTEQEYSQLLPFFFNKHYASPPTPQSPKQTSQSSRFSWFCLEWLQFSFFHAQYRYTERTLCALASLCR